MDKRTAASLDHYLTTPPEDGQGDDTLGAMVDILNSIFPGMLWDDTVEDTAARFIKYLREYSPRKPKFEDEKPAFSVTTFDLEANNQMVMCGPIQFSSICKHHLLPFLGHVWVAYISNDHFVGLSKLPRIVKWVAQRPQTQEVMTSEILKFVKSELKPRGTMVVVRSTHTCMSCRGVRETDARMTTSLPGGDFLTNPAARMEFLEFMRT